MLLTDEDAELNDGALIAAAAAADEVVVFARWPSATVSLCGEELSFLMYLWLEEVRVFCKVTVSSAPSSRCALRGDSVLAFFNCTFCKQNYRGSTARC